jgi:hypothetical protein
VSLEALNWALYDVPLNTNVDPLAKLVLITICDQADRDGCNAIISRHELSTITGISDGAVGNRLRRLLAAGLIRHGDPSATAHLRYRPAIWDVVLPSSRKIIPRPPKPSRPARGADLKPGRSARGADLGGRHEVGTRSARGRHTGADTPTTPATPISPGARASQPAPATRAADASDVRPTDVPEWVDAARRIRYGS